MIIQSLQPAPNNI